jgi:SNF family Na+-dependent transporter
MSVKVDSWGSRVGLILAMAGNAVGLGNFLRFPGHRKRFISLLFVFSLWVFHYCLSNGLQEGMEEIWKPQYSIHSRFNGERGCLNTLVFLVFLLHIASYYCYIESWTMSYVYHTLIGTFDGMSQSNVGIDFILIYHIPQLVCLTKLLFSM